MKLNLKNPYLWLGLIGLIGGLLRLYHLGHKSLWLDEAVNYQNALGTLDAILWKNSIRGSGPPAFTLMIHGISHLGHSEFGLRLSSCLAGILSIPMAYLAFKKHAGKWGALGGCLLLALSPMQIKYAQEVREYSWVVLLTMLLLYCLTRAIECKDAKHYLLFGLAAAVAIQFQYGLALVVAVCCVIVLLFGAIQKERTIGRVLISFIPIALSVLLVWHIALSRQYRQGGFAASSYLSNAYFDGSIANLPAYFVNNTESILRFAFNAECKSILLLLVVTGCCCSIVNKRHVPLLWAVGLFGLLFLTGLLSLYPYEGRRQTIFLSVPLYLMASIGIHYLQNKKAFLAISVLGGIFLIYGMKDSLSYLRSESQENIKPIAAALTTNIQPDDKIFVSLGSEPAFQYYFEPLSGHLMFPLDYYNKQREFDYRQRAEWIAAQPERTWLIFTHYQLEDLNVTLETIRKQRKVKCVTGPNEYSRLYVVESIE
jgi:hypothetical protein